MVKKEIALRVEHNGITNIAEVYDSNDVLIGIILDIYAARLMEWHKVMNNIPESFGPILAEHLLDWASQYGYAIIRPANLYNSIR